tara:strand:+ start:66 stop:281 length:216 start_codon:yes stop_codon:yes gene_type:complete
MDSLVIELAKKLKSVENEIKILQEDRRDLIADYKDKIDVKAFRAAWAILKKKENVNEVELENILDIIDNVE